jgi:diguanylate cyclase (GGDEF)-like protein/PAS domain S-box-containing protein
MTPLDGGPLGDGARMTTPDDAAADPLGGRLATAWERVLAGGGGPPLPPARLRALVRDLTRATRAGLAAGREPVDRAARAAQAGQLAARMLVQAHHTGTAALEQAVGALPAQLPGADPVVLGRFLGALAATHSDSVRQLLLEQQELVHRAVVATRDDAERALRDSEARFRALFTDAAIGISIGDMQGRILEVNEAFQRMLGISEQEFLQIPITSLVHPEDDGRTWQDYADLVAGKIEAFRAEKPYLHKDGHAVWTHLTVSLVRDPTGEPLFQVAVVEDITDRHRLQSELLHAATHDALTGLPNRAMFLQRLQAAIEAPDRNQQVAVLFVDLDSFKVVNDSRGHVVGDQVLVAVARRLAAAAADHGALLARLAGDEFVALVTSAPGSARPTDLADDLLTALEQAIPLRGQQPVHVGASVGVVELPVVDADPEDLLRTADLALHAAKEAGKGQVVTHDPTRTARQLSRFRIATDLPGAVERGELGLVYQPLILLNSGALHSVEALLRWNHPDLGPITPQLFVPVAEETSVIIAIGRWVIERACRDLAAGPWPAVNVNMSVRQLYSPTIVDDVRRHLDAAGLAPDRLRIEVTESVIMHADAVEPVIVLHQLAALGVRIVMDDFGTGYNNLAALRRLPLHEIKLAGTFLEWLHPGLAPDHVDTQILTTLVELAHTLGLTVTAEGVETLDQDQLVRAIGCDIGQGRYYAEPTPPPGT